MRGVILERRMFFRIKPSGERRYLQIVENTRDGARTVQRVLATLGRVEDLEADGKLDALLRSGARFSETALLISSLQAGTLETGEPLRIGAPLIATTRSLVRSPARSAGEPGSTRAITAPWVCLVPRA